MESKTILISTSSFGIGPVKDKLDKLTARGYRFNFNPHKRKLSAQEIKQLILEFHPVGLIAGVEPLTREVLTAAKELKVISRCGVGVDNVDLAAAKELKVRVLNTPDVLTKAVAELALGLMLDALRKISLNDRLIRKGNWQKIMGNILFAKTVGFIGCGRIASYLAGLLEGFNCRLLGFDPFVKKHKLIKMVRIEELASGAEIITLHANYDNGLHHFIDSGFLAKLKKGAILVNTARGEFIDEKAVLEALDSGALGAYCADCFETEPYTGPLINSDKTVLTSHVGSYSKEARIEMESQALDNLITVLNNEVDRCEE